MSVYLGSNLRILPRAQNIQVIIIQNLLIVNEQNGSFTLKNFCYKRESTAVPATFHTVSVSMEICTFAVTARCGEQGPTK